MLKEGDPYFSLRFSFQSRDPWPCCFVAVMTQYVSEGGLVEQACSPPRDSGARDRKGLGLSTHLKGEPPGT